MSKMLEYALLTPEEMGRADAAAIAGGVPGFTLMQAAGEAVAREIRVRWSPRPVLVLCGPGNNGGDGFVIASSLREAGWSVRVAVLGEGKRLQGDAARHAERWQAEMLPITSESVMTGSLLATSTGASTPVGLVVDALFGAGLCRDFVGPGAEVLKAAAAQGIPVCAVDIPSGIDGATGQVCGQATAADLTVTFFRKKPGHLLLPGREYCGTVVLADIGIPPAVLNAIHPRAFENAPALWLGRFPWPDRGSHKYRRGHVLVAGGATMTGAARLSALGAARAGAGLVTVAAPSQAWTVYATALTSIMVEALPDDDITPALEDTRRNAVVIGPGAGTGDQTRRNVLAAAAANRFLVLDADALTVFREDPETLFSALNAPCVMTPHDAEFARLFPVEGDKLARARRAAAKSGAVVVLKGADTVIAEPGGRAVVNANAAAWLATGGSGDVLAGMIAGLLAQGMPAFDAACAAVWLHGEAGALGGPGLISEDLPTLLPAVLRRLLEFSGRAEQEQSWKTEVCARHRP